MQELQVIDNTEIVIESNINADLFNSWIAYIDASQKTVETYTRNIRQFVYYLEDRGITMPTRADIVAYKEYLLETKKPTTVQGYLMAVKQFFKWTEQEHLYPNIADKVKAPKLDADFKKDNLTSKQAGKLLKSIDTDTLKGKRDYAILSLMLTTGLRTIEIERANVEDLRNVGDFTALYVQGKGHLERTDYVKVPAPVEEAIREYLSFRGKVNDTEPLFASVSNHNGNGRMTTRSISRIAKDNMIDAGFNSSKLTAHSLRHTAAILNLLNGGSLEETQTLLRHSSPTTTSIYTHRIERLNNNSEERIASAIFG